MDLTTVSFVIMGLSAIILSAVLITRRFPVSAAMLLIVIFTLLAGMYGLLGAHFSAVSQIIVYAGAVMVVFVFVIMLLNLPPEELRFGGITLSEIALTTAGIVVAIVLGTKVGQGHLMSGLQAITGGGVGVLPPAGRAPFYPEEESILNVASLMFTDYLWSFELISILILAATVGAVVIAKKRGQHAQSA